MDSSTLIVTWLSVVVVFSGVIFVSIPLFDLIHTRLCDCGVSLFFKRRSGRG